MSATAKIPSPCGRGQGAGSGRHEFLPVSVGIIPSSPELELAAEGTRDRNGAGSDEILHQIEEIGRSSSGGEQG